MDLLAFSAALSQLAVRLVRLPVSGGSELSWALVVADAVCASLDLFWGSAWRADCLNFLVLELLMAAVASGVDSLLVGADRLGPAAVVAVVTADALPAQDP